MNIHDLFILIIIFIGTVFFILTIFFSLNAFRKHRELIKKIMPEKVGFGSEKPKKASFFIEISSLFGNIAKPKQEKEISSMQKSLASLGYRNTRAPIIFFGIKFLLTILLPIGFLFLTLFIPKLRLLNSTFLMLILILLAMSGFYLPSLWLRMKIKKRKEKMLEGLPDTLDLLVVCTEAGMGLDAAIDRVAEEMKLDNEVISEEFRVYNLELRIGKTRLDALKSLALRTDLEEVRNLVILLIQTDKFGTSVAQALRIHSDYMRVQRSQRAEEAAAKLPIKLLIPLVFFIFPSLFTVILGPAIAQVYRIMSHH